MVDSILALATQHLDWLSTRQAVVARNVANANTPGYVAQDVQPFSALVSDGADHTGFSLFTTHPAHIAVDPTADLNTRSVAGSAWEVTHSGNAVTLEQEMIKASDIHRSYSLDTAITRAFHQMLNMAAK